MLYRGVVWHTRTMLVHEAPAGSDLCQWLAGHNLPFAQQKSSIPVYQAGGPITPHVFHVPLDCDVIYNVVISGEGLQRAVFTSRGYFLEDFGAVFSKSIAVLRLGLIGGEFIVWSKQLPTVTCVKVMFGIGRIFDSAPVVTGASFESQVWDAQNQRLVFDGDVAVPRGLRPGVHL